MTESRHPTQRRSVLLVPQVKALTLQRKLCLEKLVRLLSAVLEQVEANEGQHAESLLRLDLGVSNGFRPFGRFQLGALAQCFR